MMRQVQMLNRGLLLMKVFKLFATLALLAWPLLAGSQPAEVAEAPEEIVVVGRLPGPPLWRVSKDDHVLWIFPFLSPIPKDMIWETDNIEKVIAESGEYIRLPARNATASPLLMLNPVNLVRGYRLLKRLTRNPDGATLEEVLPAELYARFAALQAQYFSRDDDFEEMRPLIAGGRMSDIIQKEEGLVGGGDIMKTIRRLSRRNRDLKVTGVEVNIKIEGNFRSIADRAETMMESLDPEQELACFEQQLVRMEQDLDNMKLRANAWAQGNLDDFRGIPLVSDEENVCIGMVLASSEQDLLTDMETRMNRMWLEAAETALAANEKTFAVLRIDDLLRENGLLSQLKARGYEVREP